MTDGQTEACEANAEPRCVRLERGESVTFQDQAGGWHVGAVLRHASVPYGRWSILGTTCVLVHTATGIYAVEADALQPYPTRCEECGGEGMIRVEWGDISVRHAGTFEFHTCTACGGSGRKT